MSCADLETINVQTCDCLTLPQVLVHNGLFPTSPLQPRVAVSIDLLDFYFALFERSADAVSALAGALKTVYARRGFSILNIKVFTIKPPRLFTDKPSRTVQGEPIQDPFRRGIGQAVQWYDVLRRRAETEVETAIEECIARVTACPPSPKDEDIVQVCESSKYLKIVFSYKTDHVIRKKAGGSPVDGVCERLTQGSTKCSQEVEEQLVKRFITRLAGVLIILS